MSGADRRTQLLDVAREIVAAEGFGGVTIDRVARGAGVTRTVVYQQFVDLAGLITALLDRESAVAAAGMAGVAGPEFDDPAAMSAGILAYLHAAPDSWRIILRPPDGAPPQLRERIEVGRAYARSIGARQLSRVLGVPIDPDGPTQRILLTAMEELARLHLDDPDRYPDDLVRRYLGSLTAWAAGVETGTDRAPHTVTK